MAAYSREAIENVRDQADIVDLVSAYLPLKRTGRNFVACCPFHEEKTPSFNVNPERQIFKCFGCGEAGSVFDFVMKQERVEFPEALVMVARRYHVSLPEEPQVMGERRRRDDLYSLHERAQRAYREAWRDSGGEACRGYVERRGILPEVADAFGLGFAPGGPRWLVDRALGAGVSIELLERSGLGRRGTRDLYDQFRNRLLFPIRDTQDRVVAFGGRVLDDSEPKYLNSPETEIFHKGRILFGMDRLRRHRREDPILVMEGYTDVMMSAQVGVEGAVATLGTALTPDHARLLRRYTERIVLVFDGDRAGLAAAERGAAALLEAGHVEIEVAVLPEGQDPCDYFKERGSDGISELLSGIVEIVDFLIGRASSRHDLGTVAGRRRAADSLVTSAALVPDPVARQLVLQRVADALGLAAVTLERSLEARRRPARRRRPAEPEAEEGAPVRAADLAQREILQSVINDPGLLREAREAIDDLAMFPDPGYRRVFEVLLDPAAPAEEARTADFVDLFPDEELRRLVREAILPDGDPRDLRAQLEMDIRRLKNDHRHRESLRPLQKTPDQWTSEDLKQVQAGYRAKKLTRTPAPGAATPHDQDA